VAEGEQAGFSCYGPAARRSRSCGQAISFNATDVSDLTNLRHDAPAGAVDLASAADDLLRRSDQSKGANGCHWKHPIVARRGDWGKLVT
jgi:hypothetical protein